MFLPELNPVLSYLGFSKLQVAQFLTVGGAALAGQGTGGYQGGKPRGDEHWLPQIALIDSQSFQQNSTRPSYDRGNAYVAPNAYERAAAAGVIESFSCPGGQPQADPEDTKLINLTDILDPIGVGPLLAPLGLGGVVTAPEPLAFLGINAEPPCFVAPPSLFQGQKYPRLRTGRAPVVDGPRGLEGTEPVRP